MNWHSVYGDFSDLPKAEQHRLFLAIQDTLFPEPKEDIANMVGDIREVRFSNDLACVHCGSVCIKRKGNTVLVSGTCVRIVGNRFTI